MIFRNSLLLVFVSMFRYKKKILSFIGVRCFSFCRFDMIYNASIYKQRPSNKVGHLGDHIILCSPGAKFGRIFLFFLGEWDLFYLRNECMNFGEGYEAYVSKYHLL